MKENEHTELSLVGSVVEELKEVSVVGSITEIFGQDSVDHGLQQERVVDGNKTNSAVSGGNRLEWN